MELLIYVKKKREQVIEMLETKAYNKLDGDTEYKYLVKMPMDSVTEENVEKLLKEKGKTEIELETIRVTTINKMWITELDNLREQYVEYKEERARLMCGEDTKKKKVVSKGVVKKQSLLVEDD